MYKSNPTQKIVFMVFALNLIFLFPACDQILQPESAELIDADNDGYDDRDILFLQKLIDNSQGYGNSPTPIMDPTSIGDQIWIDGRLRSIIHSGGSGGFWLYNEIPSEIEGAQYLNKIKLTENYLTLIPEEIKNMSRLTEINLEKNRFVGAVPEELWKNKNLTSLAINNSFSSLPASLCEALDNINYFLFTYNNFCDVPDCITDAGVQSCDCFDYQNISQESICLDPSITCNKFLDEIISSCDLRQIWGDENFNILTSLGSEACLNWSGNCTEFVSDTSFVDNQLYIDVSGISLDCSGENSYLEYLDWLGDGTCDEEGIVNFSCGQFNCDMGDCGLLSLNGNCYCLRDCSGNCKFNEICGLYYYQYGYDCCIDDGNCVDMTGDGMIQDAIGDGYCDDGSRGGFIFNCQESDGFEFNCDGGDCGVWDEGLGECVMPAGKILKRRPEFYSEINNEN